MQHMFGGLFDPEHGAGAIRGNLPQLSPYLYRQGAERLEGRPRGEISQENGGGEEIMVVLLNSYTLST